MQPDEVDTKKIYMKHSRFVIPDKCSMIQIPKNASSTTAMWLRPEYESSRLPVENENLIAILREPMDRWRSGISQAIKCDWTELHLLTKLFDKGRTMVDFHTLPQYLYLWMYRKHNIKFYTFGPNVINEISSDYDIPYTQNISENTSEDRSKTYDVIDRYLDDNPEFIDLIKSTYIEDYKLFEQHIMPNKITVRALPSRMIPGMMTYLQLTL